MQDHKQVIQPAHADDPANVLQWQLHCPQCAAPEVEQGILDEEGYRIEEGGDHHAVTVHPDQDAYASPIGTRGGYVDVRLWCAAGHVFSLVVANHKGAQFIAVVSLAG